MFILGILIRNNTLMGISENVLFVALVFAVMSGMEHVRVRVKRARIGKEERKGFGHLRRPRESVK